MSLDKKKIEKAAHLARIAIEDADIPPVLDSINRIVGLIDKMQQVDTTGIKPLANPHDATARLREDKVTATDNRDKLLANAPETENGLFLVPKVID